MGSTGREVGCRIRFYGSLNDLLPEARRASWIDYPLDGDIAAKHAIEALGVPHPEVDQIVADGEPVRFSHRLRIGEQVGVYPKDCNPPIDEPIQLRPPVPRPPRFVLDTHLGRLAAYLRMMGFDTVYRNNYKDPELAAIAHEDRRILLTRDRGLLKRKVVVYGFCIRHAGPRQQLVEVARRYNLAQDALPWTRCVRCNGLLQPVDKADIIDLLEPKTKLYYDEFQRCTSCGQIYWRGSHHDRMRNLIAAALNEARNQTTAAAQCS